MRQFTLSVAGIALAALLSSAPAMAQAYNTDLIGWNRGGSYIANTTGNVQMCFKGKGGKFNGPPLLGKSDAATHGWQNFWGPCDNGSAAAKPQQVGAKPQQTARR